VNGAQSGSDTPKKGRDVRKIRKRGRDENASAETASAPPSFPENGPKELWPEWYAIGYSVPGWKVSLAVADAWKVNQKVPDDLAETKAYALREWWARLPKNGKRQREGNPYFTWQRWCREDRDKIPGEQRASNGRGPPGRTTRAEPRRDWRDYPDEF
jgi:hypothetical protein